MNGINPDKVDDSRYNTKGILRTYVIHDEFWKPMKDKKDVGNIRGARLVMNSVFQEGAFVFLEVSDDILIRDQTTNNDEVGGGRDIVVRDNGIDGVVSYEDFDAGEVLNSSTLQENKKGNDKKIRKKWTRHYHHYGDGRDGGSFGSFNIFKGSHSNHTTDDDEDKNDEISLKTVGNDRG
ncbi:hypothetical protein G210_2338 [Candida maltosa Xu316]|uniref:Uncharacterized protein n=1 Tax=Candida maltosa (strain Xu316) TaxID=1245528 RepID=M3IV94_CANMX|nr:hypothetical protein G210_2338 [Candida maltosa Xu316]